MRRYIILLPIILALASCVSGPKISTFGSELSVPTDGRGQMIVYAPLRPGFLLTASILINGEKISKGGRAPICAIRGVNIINLAPGEHFISMNTGEYEASLNVKIEEGKRTFVRCIIKPGAIGGIPDFNLVHPKTGEKEVFGEEWMGLLSKHDIY